MAILDDDTLYLWWCLILIYDDTLFVVCLILIVAFTTFKFPQENRPRVGVQPASIHISDNGSSTVLIGRAQCGGIMVTVYWWAGSRTYRLETNVRASPLQPASMFPGVGLKRTLLQPLETHSPLFLSNLRLCFSLEVSYSFVVVPFPLLQMAFFS